MLPSETKKKTRGRGGAVKRETNRQSCPSAHVRNLGAEDTKREREREK